MNSIDKANAACALANITGRAHIRALKAAIVEMKEMRDCGDLPADCLSALNAHLALLRHHKDMSREMLAARKSTCSDLTECLTGGGVVVQDGGK